MANAQYYDLNVGTERHFYNCFGLTSGCVALDGENVVGIEKVQSETVMNGRTWSVVSWMTWHDWWSISPSYFTEENANHISLHMYRMDGSRLMELVDGQEVARFDFELTTGDSLAPHFAMFELVRPLDANPYNASDFGLASVVRLDTIIAFPDGVDRRVIWADDPATTNQGMNLLPTGRQFVDEVLEEGPNVLFPGDFPEIYRPYRPYYYIEDVGVFRTPVNHHGMIMTGYKKASGISRGWMLPVSTSVPPEMDHPTRVVLHQNYPNPFNPITVIPYSLYQSMLVKLSIFDIMGREIAILENSFILAGKHNVVFDANNMVSGIYFYQLKIGTTIHSKKMLLIK
jgi:hypothetical protein